MGKIERDLLDEKPLDGLLRKLILFGGVAGSSELRDWASAELRGYENDKDVPEYRKVTAPIQINGSTPRGLVEHQTISTVDLPDFVRDEISESFLLRMGVREIQSMIDQHAVDRTVRLQPAGVALIVDYMNRTSSSSGWITELYWGVSTIALEGVLDQVRTRLAELIAELRAGTQRGQTLPTPAQAANAVNLVVNGRGNRVNISQAAGGGVIASTPPRENSGFWTRARVVGAAIAGIATVGGTIIAALQLWQ